RLKHGLLDTFGRFLDFTQSADDIARDVIRHFPGLIEMMPAPELSRFDFFDHDAWPSGGARPTARLMNAARQARDGLAPPDDRFHQLIGVGETTVVDARLEDDEFVFSVSDDGDGTVPRRLAAMGDVRRYFVEGEHMWLCNDDDVIAGVAEILANGATSALSHAAPAADGVEIESRAPLTIARSLSGSADRRGAPNAATILHAMHDAPSRSESPPAAAGRSADSERANDHLRGYRLRDVLDAGRAWFDLASERRLMEAHVASGRSALAETPQRLDLYEKRLTRILASQPASLLRSVPRGMSAELAAEMRDDGVDAEALKRIRQERKIGEFEEFLSVEFLKRGGLALSPVCRIVTVAGRQGFGTGFLVAPDVVITNNHVLGSKAAVLRAAAEFSFERDVRRREISGRVAALDPDRLFVTNSELDFTLVALSRSDAPPHEDFGFLPLNG
ncbi:MAG: trypsin-like peptidase domain-containing protein, partial [Pseudomonadota bacterium]